MFFINNFVYILYFLKYLFEGYVVNGFYGENINLNFKERSDVVKAVKNIIGKKKTLIVSSNSECWHFFA